MDAADTEDCYQEMLQCWATAVYGKEWHGEVFANRCAMNVAAMRLLNIMIEDMRLIDGVVVTTDFANFTHFDGSK